MRLYHRRLKNPQITIYVNIFFSCSRAHAADRGVAIRIYLDGAQFAEREAREGLSGPRRDAGRRDNDQAQE